MTVEAGIWCNICTSVVWRAFSRCAKYCIGSSLTIFVKRFPGPWEITRPVKTIPVSYPTSEVPIINTLCRPTIQFGKFYRYFRTSSSAKWAKISNSFFHLFIQVSMGETQFLPLKRIKPMENLIYWMFCSFGATWGSKITDEFSIQAHNQTHYIGYYSLTRHSTRTTL